jgi:hypothetical protein
MALARVPTLCTLRDLLLIENQDPATDNTRDAGSTSEPEGFTVPAVQFVERRTQASQASASRMALMSRVGVITPSTQRPDSANSELYESTLIVTRHAAEGANKSIYLGKGVYETNFTYDTESAQSFKKKEGMELIAANASNFLKEWKAGTPRVYFVMNDTIAQMNLQAETEHCNDFLLAYQMTLGALETALAHAASAVIPPAPSAQVAHAARVAKLQEFLPVNLKDVVANLDLCGQKYRALSAKSKDRDGKLWHSYGLEYLDPGPLPPTVHYLTGKARPGETGHIFLQYTKGQTQIGTHSSASVITF